ncbi:fibulin-7-like [Xenentodon cancila]
MKAVGTVVLMLALHHMALSSVQDCPSTHELLNSLRLVEKMLAVHETSYREGLRHLRKKMIALHNSTMALFKIGKNASCPKPEPLAHGRRLGRVFDIGHEVHFLCKPGYDLLGSRTRICLESLTWSGQQPLCRHHNVTANSRASSAAASAAAAYSSSPSAASLSPPYSASSPTQSSASSSSSSSMSHCTYFLDSMHCTCDVGFTMSDHNVCTDIDECRGFHRGRPGRRCIHQCVNTPGSFHCVCPPGYSLAADGRSCTDVDECETRMHNCKADHICVNTFGGFQCVTVKCPRMANLTYVKSDPMRCEKKPCMLGDKACAQAANSITFHFLAVVSNVSVPRILFRVSAARLLGNALRFGLSRSRGRGYFSVQRSGRQTGTLVLVTPIGGPASLEANVEMCELEDGAPLSCYLTKVTLFVSPYTF